MVTVTVMYPRTDDVTFDMDYYKGRHFDLLRERLGDNLQRDEIHEVVDGPYVAYCQMYFDSMEGFGGPMAEHGAEIMGDVPNYTNVQPVMLISNTDA
ncbi:MAG: EthD family reductase [Actinomycetota bacterium]|nr:EthD family reductase [Actinomycetota bacterium]